MKGIQSGFSPLAPGIDKGIAVKSSRVKRGLYQDGGFKRNADCVGAFNIVRLYLAEEKKT